MSSRVDRAKWRDLTGLSRARAGWQELCFFGHKVRSNVQLALTVLAFRYVDFYMLGLGDGARDAYRRDRRADKRDWHRKSREDGYKIGYRHGKKDARALRLVVDNEAVPVDLYPARHAASG
jgi:hypothetical protein